jgi:hypothetical protein
LSLYRNNQILQSVSADDVLGFGYIYQNELAPGDYRIVVSNIQYANDAVEDYTVSIYAEDAIEIKD